MAISEPLLADRRRSRAEIEAVLRANGVELRGKECRCPFHDDAHASAGVFEGKDGDWRFRCQAAGCGWHGDVYDLEAALSGKPLREVLPKDAPAVKLYAAPAAPKVYSTLDALAADVRHAVDVDRYTDPDTGKVDLVVIRCEPPGDKKRFVQCHQSAQFGGWVMKKPPGAMPLFNRTRLRSSPWAVVVEGERCVKALTAVGVVATTSPGGAGKGRAEEADWRPLSGKDVWLWPDHDEGGADHMRAAARLLDALPDPPRLSWVEPSALGLPPKGDAVDFLKRLAGKTPREQSEAVDAALGAAEPLAPSAALRRHIEDAIAGKLRSVPWPWRGLSRLARALLPGTLTLLCGEGGATKSFLLLQALWSMHAAGVRVALYALEGGPAHHLARLQAQLDGNADLTDPDWIRENASEARASYQRHRAELDGFARRLTAEQDKAPTLADLAAWAQREAAAGARVVAIDPVTAAEPTQQPWVADRQFVMTLRVLARKHDCSLVVVTHPKTGAASKGMAPLDALAGGAAYPRHSETVLWLKRHDEPQSSQVAVAGSEMTAAAQHNRTLRLGKTRNGPGAGLALAYQFDPRTLTFREEGVIRKKDG